MHKKIIFLLSNFELFSTSLKLIVTLRECRFVSNDNWSFEITSYEVSVQESYIHNSQYCSCPEMWWLGQTDPMWYWDLARFCLEASEIPFDQRCIRSFHIWFHKSITMKNTPKLSIWPIYVSVLEFYMKLLF